MNFASKEKKSNVWLEEHDLSAPDTTPKSEFGDLDERMARMSQMKSTPQPPAPPQGKMAHMLDSVRHWNWGRLLGRKGQAMLTAGSLLAGFVAKRFSKR